MNKLLIAVVIIIPFIGLSACTFNNSEGVNSVVYNPGYSNDYVYSVGVYNNRPYWGNNYFGGEYGWTNKGYWGGGYYNGY